MGKILHKLVPNCCDIEFKATSRNGTTAVIPSLAKSSSSRSQALYDQLFAVLGPKLWNKVPSTLRLRAAQSFDAFKISLSNFLDLIPDNPLVTGYSCRWSNSLVDFTSDI
jgi:phosphatidylinositol kinase/protein kinase (PI-3  family)